MALRELWAFAAPCTQGQPSEKTEIKKVELGWRSKPLDLASSGVWFQCSALHSWLGKLNLGSKRLKT